MRPKLTHALSFVTMTILVFVLTNYLNYTFYSTGPNEDGTIGFTQWIQLHRRGFNWSADHFNLLALAGEILIAIALTWLLSILLKTFKQRKIVRLDHS